MGITYHPGLVNEQQRAACERYVGNLQLQQREQDRVHLILIRLPILHATRGCHVIGSQDLFMHASLP